MKKMFTLIFVLLSALCMGNACEDVTEGSEKLCGACPTIEGGGVNFTGDARVDGLFKAIGSLKASTGTINAGFNTELELLAETFGVDAAASSNLVADVKAAIVADITANVSGGVEGGLEINFQKPKCTANASLAVEASASCQVEAGCTVSAECQAGEVDVKCEGQCSGSCEGGCSAGSLPECKVELDVSGGCSGSCEGSCEVTGPALECEGECSGSCTVSAGMRCEGSCSGNCTGTCDGNTSEGGSCAGKCEGECDAECTIQGSGKCEGTCNGSCSFTPPDAHCEGSCKGECKIAAQADGSCTGGEAPSCSGSCEGSCSGSCEGSVTPPSCSVEGSCDAAADCEASASAEANASLECTPPSLDISFALKADVDAQVAANFKARMEIFKKSMMSIAQGAFKLKGLVTGDATLGIEPPTVQIANQVKLVGDALVSGQLDIDIPALRIGCAIAAASEATGAISGIKADLAGTIDGQVEILSIINVGGLK